MWVISLGKSKGRILTPYLNFISYPATRLYYSPDFFLARKRGQSEAIIKIPYMNSCNNCQQPIPTNEIYFGYYSYQKGTLTKKDKDQPTYFLCSLCAFT